MSDAPETLDLDLQRLQRCGFPEVVYAAGKTVAEALTAARRLHAAHGMVLLTRARPDQLQALIEAFPQGEVYARCGAFLVDPPPATHGPVAVVSAGTSDEGVSEEVIATLRARGVVAEAYRDCGVAGLHRLLAHREGLARATVAVAVAGFEAALTSVLAGLVACPVIGCPTSVGYGVCDGGRTALNSMLACCAPGVSVVNIDNGFGAGYQAASIARLAAPLTA